MKKLISKAALKRIITAYRGHGSWCKWVLSFSLAQAREEGLSEPQIKIAHETFGQYHGVVVVKSEMVEIIYGALVEIQ
jgi:hypothetical protein